jgi:hypothetical protein
MALLVTRVYRSGLYISHFTGRTVYLDRRKQRRKGKYSRNTNRCIDQTFAMAGYRYLKTLVSTWLC